MRNKNSGTVPSSDGNAYIVTGDARHLPLPDQSINLVVTSPPYFGLRSYHDGGEHYSAQIGAEPTPAQFVDALLETTVEMMRVLTPDGSLWINLGDKYNAYNGNRGEGNIQSNGPRQTLPTGHGLDVKTIKTKSLLGVPWRYAIRCIDDLGLILRAEVIWAKKNGLPESVTDRVRRSHETWFHFTLRPRYYANIDEIREPLLDTSAHAANRRNRTDRRLTDGTHGQTSTSHTKGKLPSSVWTHATQPLRVPPELQVNHFAAFPMVFPQRIISGWCPPDGVVLDPFGGTGTTALVAKALGRTGITNDFSSDYARIAQWRLNDPAQLARAGEIRL